jgi:hypothetical protein
MKRLNATSILIISIITFLFVSCGTSTGSRYSKSSSDSTGISSDKGIIKLNEDFDITSFKTKIEVLANNQRKNNESSDIWYDYDSLNTNDNNKTLVGTEDGYRVLVISSDNQEDVEQIKSDIANIVDNNEMYIDFEPPFYKLKVGDFSDLSNANNLRFKLNQLGYKEARVIKETVNVFK